MVKSLKDRLRDKFNVAVAEIDYQDLWQRAAGGGGDGIVAITAHAEKVSAVGGRRGRRAAGPGAGRTRRWNGWHERGSGLDARTTVGGQSICELADLRASAHPVDRARPMDEHRAYASPKRFARSSPRSSASRPTIRACSPWTSPKCMSARRPACHCPRQPPRRRTRAAPGPGRPGACPALLAPRAGHASQPPAGPRAAFRAMTTTRRARAGSSSC